MVKILFHKMGDLLQDTIVKMLFLYTLIQFHMVMIIIRLSTHTLLRFDSCHDDNYCMLFIQFSDFQRVMVTNIVYI